MRRETIHGQRGATLVELIVGMSIGVLLLLFIGRFFGSQNRTYVSQISAAELRGGLRVSMDLLQRELRNAGYNPMQAGFLGVEFDSTRLILRGDFNADGLISGEDEAVSYYRDAINRTLMRAQVSPGVAPMPQVVLDEVDTFDFVLFDRGGVRIVDPVNSDAIAEVMIKLVARSAGAHGADASKNRIQSNRMVVTVAPVNLGL